jgi:hypothetical protein
VRRGGHVPTIPIDTSPFSARKVQKGSIIGRRSP